MKPRVYLETTIPSYLAARRSRDLQLAADQEATEEWWEIRRSAFDIYISEIVLREISKGDSTFAGARLAIVQGLPILAPDPIAEEIAVRLVEKQIIPATAADDAAHIALAAAHRMDFLLTWNCKHINNAAIQRRIERECDALGAPCPVICTPDELMIS